MRIIFSLLLLTFFSSLQAQEIQGTVRDAEGKPLNGATISLLKDTGTKVIKLAVAKDNGSFSFTAINPGRYRINATSVGYQPSVSPVFTLDQATLQLPEIKMTKASGDMKNVVVTAKKPIIEVKADKMIVNVEGTINAVGTDALELLRKSPGVQVDKDENLSVNGKNGVQVYIDGRPSPISGQDLANYLKSLQSAQIESIEIITNPSAKYEAAGNAGIINIRLKKNKSMGTNGSVNAGYNIGVYPKYNAGLSLNHRNAKFNAFGNFTYSHGRNENTLNIDRSVRDSSFNAAGNMNMRMTGQNFKGGLDYFINKKSTLGVMVNGNFAKPEISNYSRTPITYKPTNTVTRILIADNRSEMKRNNLNLNLNYSYTGTDGKSLTLNADHGTYDINSDQYQPNMYYSPNGQTLLSSVIYQMIAPSDITINSFKADYEQNLGKGKLGLGAKSSFVKTDNDFQRYNVYTSGKQLDQDRSNRFRYSENINAGYANYNRAFKGFMIQAGVRVENTVLEGRSNGQKNNGSGYAKYDSTFRREYTDLFPSAAFTYNKNPMSQLSLTFSRRIDRPAYQDLNPFEFKLDEYSFQKGNINLRPQYTNSIGLTHTYKYKLNTTLNYSHVNNLFTQLIDTAEGSKSFISKQNLATQDIVSLNISYPFQYKAYTLFTNMSSNYAKYKADFGNGRKVDLDAFGLNLFAQNSLKFSKTWTAELSGFFNAPTIYQGSFKAKAMGSVDAGLQKQVFGGNGTIKASVSDIFHTLRFQGTSDFAGQQTTFTSRWESRQFKLNFVYRFGSSQVKGARQRSTASEEEAKRTQGGGGMGIGQ